MRLSPLPFLTLSLLAAAVSVATAQTQGHELDRPTTVEPHPVLTPGAPLLHRHLTPEQYRRWQTHPPLINADAAAEAAGPLNLVPVGRAEYASGPVGDIFVMEGNTQLVLSIDQQGNPCSSGQCYPILNPRGGSQVIANRVIQDMGDKYDSIVIWTTFEDYSVAAYYQPLRNDIGGLGVCDQSGQDQSGLFGCTYDQTGGLKLQGVIYMNSIAMWQQVDEQWNLTYALEDDNSQIYATLGQESAHRWGTGFQFRDPRTGRVSKALLGRDGSHWNLKVDAAASWMDGLDWRDDGGGLFSVIADNDGYSQLDLYGMGLLSADEVEPFFIVEGASSSRLQQIYRQFGITIPATIPDGTDGLPAGFPPMELVGSLPATGTRVDVTMDQVLSACGPRLPNSTQSQKTFNQAFVLVTRPGQTAASVSGDVDNLDTVRRNWERIFAEKTGGKGVMCTALGGTCAPPVADVVAIRVTDDGNNPADGEWGRGEELNIYTVLTNRGGGAISNVTATLTSSSPDVEIVNGTVSFGAINAGAQVESATGFRARLGSTVSCETRTVPVTVAVTGGGQTREFQAAIKACGGDEQPKTEDPPSRIPGLPPGFGPCLCAQGVQGGVPMAALMLGVLLAVRGRRRQR